MIGLIVAGLLFVQFKRRSSEEDHRWQVNILNSITRSCTGICSCSSAKQTLHVKRAFVFLPAGGFTWSVPSPWPRFVSSTLWSASLWTSPPSPTPGRVWWVTLSPRSLRLLATSTLFNDTLLWFILFRSSTSIHLFRCILLFHSSICAFVLFVFIYVDFPLLFVCSVLFNFLLMFSFLFLILYSFIGACFFPYLFYSFFHLSFFCLASTFYCCT